VALIGAIFLLPAPVGLDLVLSPPEHVDQSDHLSRYLRIYCNQFLILHTLTMKIEAKSSTET
jgi:hypothetical protein